MAFIHGKSTGVLWHDQDLSGYLNEASMPGEIEAAETTVFGDGNKTYISGLADGTVSLSGYLDDAGEGVNTIAAVVADTREKRPITVGHSGGLVDGAACHIADSMATSFEVTSAVADVVEVSAEFQADGGVWGGHLLEALQSISTATTTNGTPVSNGASSANGAHATLHITANAADDTTIVTVQDSADGAAWVDLITFTTVATGTTTSEYKSVAGTVDSYLRAETVTAGSGAVVVTVAAARK